VKAPIRAPAYFALYLPMGHEIAVIEIEKTPCEGGA
jgi:hypothetical protein